MLEAERYYKILDLQLGASPEEIHQGYIDMTWVWHPDRFAGHPRLQQKAHHKLQEINEAHACLRSVGTRSRSKSLSKSTYQTYPHYRASKPGLYQPPASQPSKEKEKNKTTRTYVRRCVRTQSRDINDWLD